MLNLKTQIVNGDCVDVMKEIPENSIQTIITSCPYNLDKSYEQKKSMEEYLAFYIPVIEQIKRVLKDTGSCFWQVGNCISGTGKQREVIPLDIIFYDLFKEQGFKLRNRIIWHFGHGLHNKHSFSGRYETVNWWTKSDEYHFDLDLIRVPQKYPGKKYFKGKKKGEYSCNPLGANPTDVWHIGNVKHNHPEKSDHSCMFPQKLAANCILSTTKPNDVVLDPFCGSGQAVIAAVKNNRIGIGIDIIKEYTELAEKRLDEAKKTIKVQ